MSTAIHAHSVSFSDDVAPSSSIASSSSHVNYSSPSKNAGAAPGSASKHRAHPGPLRLDALVPLAPAKTVSLGRRAVNFSPRLDTKYFRSSDSIIPSSDDPPASIRSYFDYENAPCSSSPIDSPSLYRNTPTRNSSETPSIVRSILKSRIQEIRIASSVEEGTLNNKEPARLIVTGKRPRIVARDSFQLAMMRKAASDGLEGGETSASGKGKGKMEVEEQPGSDDSVASEDSKLDDQGSVISSEEEEEVEEDGELAAAALIKIILEGADDLLTLEEAYNTLSTRLRQRFQSIPSIQNLSPAARENVRLATQPIRDEAPAVIRAIQRDIQRLLGKISNFDGSSSSDNSMPYRSLKPLRDSPPTAARSAFVPSPSVTPSGRTSPGKAARQGYTESEVRFRREASGVGAAALRFLAFAVHCQHLWECFSEADLTSLIDQVLHIPRTPRLPTPNPKRSYWLAIVILTQMKLPIGCVAPLRERIVRAIDSALNDGLGSPARAGGQTTGGMKDMGQLKREGYHAIINLLNLYPTVFYQEFATLLPPCFRGMVSPSPMVRNKASAAAAAFAAAKLNLLGDWSSKSEWDRNRAIVQRSEIWVVAQLRPKTLSTTTMASNGQKRLDWIDLEKVFKATVGDNDHVAWACATWSILLILIGQAHETSGIVSGTNTIDHIMDRSLTPTTNLQRPLLASIAWNHAIHSYLLASSVTSLPEDNRLAQSFSPWSLTSGQDWQSRLNKVLLPVNYALDQATDRNNYSTFLNGSIWQWNRQEGSKKTSWMLSAGQMATSVVYAYSGMALYHVDQPASEMTAITGLPSSDGGPVPGDIDEIAKNSRLDKTWDRVVRPLIKRLSSVCGVDDLKIQGWRILNAILVPEPQARHWSLDRLCSATYLSGEVFVTEKEVSIADLKTKLDMEVIRPSEIPAWGSSWVVTRLDDILDLFQDLISNMSGISRPIQEWILDDSDSSIIPSMLSTIWTRIIQAVATYRPTPLQTSDSEDAENDGTASKQGTYRQSLILILRHLLQIFNRDPASEVPLERLNKDGKTIPDADSFRINLFSHFLDIVIRHLTPEDVGRCLLRPSPTNAVDTLIASTAFGSVDSQTTMAGSILGQLLQPPRKVLSPTLGDVARAAFCRVVEQLLDIGVKEGDGFKLLQDIAVALPAMFPEQEDLRLDVWRMTCSKCLALVESTETQQAVSTSVTLLACPFQGAQIDSVWHQRASLEDLKLWQALLKASISRCKQARLDSNFEILERLVGHIKAPLLDSAKTSSTTITLSCLASAVSYLSFPGTQGDDPTSSIQIPVDFLAIVSNALLDSYPSAESQARQQAVEDDTQIYSEGVNLLVGNLVSAIEALPAEYTLPFIMACRPGLETWLMDELRVAKEPLYTSLDSLYVTALSSTSRAINAGSLDASVDLLQSLLTIIAPRLSRGQTVDVPRAFQSFWEPFSSIHARNLPEDVRTFVEQVLRAVPAMITVPGLTVEGSLSEEESQSLFPHALDVTAQQASGIEEDKNEVEKDAERYGSEVLVDATEMDIDPTAVHAFGPDTTEAYDADVSQPETQQPRRQSPRTSKRSRKTSSDQVIDLTADDADDHTDVATQSEGDSAAKSERGEAQQIQGQASSSGDSMEAQRGGDVFGPTGKPKTPKTRKSRKKASRASSKRESKIESSSQGRILTRELSPRRDEHEPRSEEDHLVPASGSAEEEIPPGVQHSHLKYQIAPSSDVEVTEDHYDIPPSSEDVEAQELPEQVEVEETEESESIEATQNVEMPTVVDETILLDGIPAEDAPLAGTGRKLGRHPRPSLLSSAKGWLARVPTFGFLSPTQSRVSMAILPEVPAQPAALAAAQLTEGQQSPTEGGESQSKFKGKGKKRRLEEGQSAHEIDHASQVSGGPSKRRSKQRHPRRRDKSGTSTPQREASPVVANNANAEDDELLLTPESARKRKREEEQEIQAGISSKVEPQERIDRVSPHQTRSRVKQEEEEAKVASSRGKGSSKRRSRGRASKSSKSSRSSRSDLSNAGGDAPVQVGGSESKGDGRSESQANIQETPKRPRHGSARSGESSSSSAVASGSGSSTTPSSSSASGSGSDPLTGSSLSSEANGNDGILSPFASPSNRSTEQTRLLSMLDQAASRTGIVDNLDLDGVLALMRNVDTLRVAAQENLARRAEEARAAKRRRRGE